MKRIESWYSHQAEHDVHLVRWGEFGTPVLLFPTAGGDAEEVERFHVVDSLAPLLDEGLIKLYSVDSFAGRRWLERELPPGLCSKIQNAYHATIAGEVVPAIRQDCRNSDIEIITAGSSIGALNAVAVLCRYPELFRSALCLSGTYDITSFLHGEFNDDFYFSSPVHFLPSLEGATLHRLRERFVLFAFGEGEWEDPEESWRLANILGSKGIPNRVDSWGPQFGHNWSTWRDMMPHYLRELSG